MSTLRISNIEAKADNSSPTVDEQLKFTNSTGDVMLHLDGRTSGITTVGINTTAQTIKFDANNNVMVTGIITATEFHGTLAVGTSVTYGDNEKAYFGNGLDLQIFHDSSGGHSRIDDTGTGGLVLRGSNILLEKYGGGYLANFKPDDSVDLFYAGNKKFETTNTGAVVTGILTATTFSGSIAASNINSGTVATARLGSGTANSSTFLRGDQSWAAVTSTTINNNADNRIITGSGTANTLEGESNLTFDGTTVLIQNSGSGLRNLLRLKNSNASAGVSGLYFNSTTSGSAFDAACVRNGVNGSGQGRLFLQTNNGSGLVNGLEIDYDGQVTLPTNSLNILDSIVHIGDTNTKIRFPAADTITAETAGNEALRINSSSQILIGTTSDVAPDSFGSKLQIDSGNAAGSISIGRHTNSGSGPVLLFHKSRSGSGSGATIVNDGDNLGTIRFYGADGTDRNSYGANISANVDGTPGSNDLPGNLVFSTTADGAASATERLRITSKGFVGIGEDDPQTKLNVRGCVSTGRNVAREVGTIIDISSNYSTGRNGTSVINGQKNYEEDGNADWITAGGSRANANLTIDLGSQYYCDRFVIYNQNEYASCSREVKRFTLEGSNDKSSWTTLLDDECGASYAHEPNPGFSFRIPSDFTDDDEGASYRYWRFTMKTYHGSDSHGGVMELELYEGDSNNKTISEVSTHHLSAQDITAQNIYHDLPCFYSARASSQTMSDQTWTKVALTDDNSGAFDTNGFWDNSNYRFTPTIPGYYQFNYNMSISHGSIQASYIAIYKNGSVFTQTGRYFFGNDNYDDATMNTSALIHLDGDDYVEFWAWRLGGSNSMGGTSAFCQASGFLVRHAGYRHHGNGAT